MKHTLLYLPRQDEQVPLHLHIWQPDTPARAVVHIAHGMAEHILRYEYAARSLCDQGFLVCGSNHRGHGYEWPEKRLGHFADRDGWDKVLLDMHAVMTYVKNEHPGLPYVLLGHSMGSFLAREFALRYGKELSALVLSGTGFYPGALCAAGTLMASLFPRRKPAPLLDKLVFSSNNAPFSPARTPFDWLSRDAKQVDKYIADSRCGFVFTGASYKAFFQGLLALSREGRLLLMQKGVPVYLLSGKKDPVGQMGKGVEKVAQQLRRAGVSRADVKLYPDCRHELFNELNRDEVLDDLCAWLHGALHLG